LTFFLNAFPGKGEKASIEITINGVYGQTISKFSEVMFQMVSGFYWHIVVVKKISWRKFIETNVICRSFC